MTSNISLERFCCVWTKTKELWASGHILSWLNASGSDSEFAPNNKEVQGIHKCFNDLLIDLETQNGLIFEWIAGDKPYNTDLCAVDPCGMPTTPSNMFYMFIWIMLFVGTVSSNFAVIMAVHKTPYLRDNIGNYFISSLAVSDLLLGLFIIPVKMKFTANNLNYCSQNLCTFWIISDTTLFSVSITNIFVISIDRYMALTYPYKYRKWMTYRRGKLLALCVWVYGIVWGILGTFNWEDTSRFAIEIQMDQCLIVNKYYMTTAYVVVFYIPAIIMAVLYLRILNIARKHARDICGASFYRNKSATKRCGDCNIDLNKGTVTDDDDGAIGKRCVLKLSSVTLSGDSNIDLHKESVNCEIEMSSKAMKMRKYRQMTLKANRTIAAVYGMFFVCWFPVSVYTLVLQNCGANQCIDQPKWKWFFNIFTEILPVFNSMMNPFIYAIASKHFRRAYRDLLSGLKVIALAQFGKEVKARNVNSVTLSTKQSFNRQSFN